MGNLYLPPESACQPGYKAKLDAIPKLELDFLFGDFNGHSPLWHSVKHDKRGKEVEEMMDSSTLTPSNLQTPTRLPPNGLPSSLDITLVESSLATSVSWQVLLTLGSDHLPILLSLPGTTVGKPLPHRSYKNFKKANWDIFEGLVDSALVGQDKFKNCRGGRANFPEFCAVCSETGHSWRKTPDGNGASTVGD